MLGTSNAWSVTRLFKRTSDTVYYIIDWRISNIKPKSKKLQKIVKLKEKHQKCLFSEGVSIFYQF